MARVIPFRFLIALFLAAWTPFCCCNLHSVMNVCEVCGEHGHRDADGDDDHDGGNAPHTHANVAHHHDEDSLPAQQDKHKNDQKRCNCDGNKLTSIGLDKSTIEFPASALLFLLPRWETSWYPRWPLMALPSENRSPLRPATSLLYQHCALIV